MFETQLKYKTDLSFVMLFVVTRPHFEKKGLPVFLSAIYTEQFDEKKPTNSITTNDWLKYKPVIHGTVVPEAMKLPSQVILVCKGIRSFVSDMFVDSPHLWIVSERLLTFWQQRDVLQGQYEQANLTIVSNKGKSLTEQSYLLLRIKETNDKLVDFTSSPSVPSEIKPLSKNDPRPLFYTELKLLTSKVPPAMVFHERSLRWVLVCQESIKKAMEAEGFMGLDYYTLSDFAQESRIREMSHSVEEYDHYKKQVAAGNLSGPFSKKGLTGPNRLS